MKSKLHGFLITLAMLAVLTQSALAGGPPTPFFSITPNVVSNTYNGKITLLITNLASVGDGVLIRKYLDANANGVVDAGDTLWQQFSMTDGVASVFHDGSTAVTNFNVPGDTDTTQKQITAQLNFQNGDFSQNIVGKYLYVLSNPNEGYTPVTNSFTVTNFPFAHSFSGNVYSNNTTTAISNAVVILFQPGSDGSLNPQSGTVANNTGAYSISAPAGTYQLVAFRSNYLDNLATAPSLALDSSSIVTNLMLTNATQKISGKIVDTNAPSVGIPGFLLPMQSTNNFLAVAFDDTNGNFSAGTISGVWKIESDDHGLNVHGYLALQNNINTNSSAGSVSGLTIALPKATAIFYGTVKDIFGNPLAGIDIYAQDDNNEYQADAYTDANGKYVVAALDTNFQANISTDSNPTNYVYSQGMDTALTNGQAQLLNFTAILATNHITGHVQDSTGKAVAYVAVFASATISNIAYQPQADTDSNGNYSLNVPNAEWNPTVICNGGNDSLDGIFTNGNYSCPNNQDLIISNDNGTANFTVQLCNGVQITTASPLPHAQQGQSYYIQLNASSCNNNFIWSVNDPADFPSALGMNFDSAGEIFGTPTGSGSFSFSVHVDDNNGHTADTNLSLAIYPVPVLSLENWLTNRFQMKILAGSNQNYTVQMSTNLSYTNWLTLFVTNNPATNSFILTDPNATNKQRFYRILIGP